MKQSWCQSIFDIVNFFSEHEKQVLEKKSDVRSIFLNQATLHHISKKNKKQNRDTGTTFDIYILWGSEIL